ncbi:MAG: IPT/TIG domain-containing protein [Myxococcota bacterium]
MFLPLLVLLSCVPSRVTLGDSDQPRRDRDDTAADTDPVDTADTDADTDVDTDTDTDTALDTSVHDTGETSDIPLVLAVDLVSPSMGSTEGGETVTVYGGPFDASASVVFGHAGRGRVDAWTSTTLTVVSPASASEGPVDVVVDAAGGTGMLAAGYVFEEPCTGIVASPSSTTVDHATSSDITVTLTGCALSMTPGDDMRTYFINGATEYQTGVSWTTMPASVDGTATATLRWTTRTWGGAETTPIGDVYTATIATEFGNVLVEVTTR